jgi:hypothetical protein
MKLLAAGFLAMLGALSAQDLKGISQVQVQVRFYDGTGGGQCAEKVLATRYGLLPEPIKTETELRLREAGLNVGNSGPPTFLIDVSACSGVIVINYFLRELSTVRGRTMKYRVGKILEG